MPGGPHTWLICPCSLQAPHLQPCMAPLASPPALGAPGRAAYLPGSWHHSPVRSADPTAPLQGLFPGPAWTGRMAARVAARLTLQPGVRILPLLFQVPHLPPAAPGATARTAGSARSGGLRWSHRGGCSPCRCQAARLRPGSLCRPPPALPPLLREGAPSSQSPRRSQPGSGGENKGINLPGGPQPGAKPSLCLPARRGNGGRGGGGGHRTPRCARLQSNTGTLILQKGHLPLPPGPPGRSAGCPQPHPAPNQVPLASTELGTAPRPCLCVPEDISRAFHGARRRGR